MGSDVEGVEDQEALREWCQQFSATHFLLGVLIGALQEEGDDELEADIHGIATEFLVDRVDPRNIKEWVEACEKEAAAEETEEQETE